mgnify:CR=1 FL=1
MGHILHVIVYVTTCIETNCDLLHLFLCVILEMSLCCHLSNLLCTTIEHRVILYKHNEISRLIKTEVKTKML